MMRKPAQTAALCAARAKSPALLAALSLRAKSWKEPKENLTSYQLDFTKCSLCGMCVESCPTDALTFSHDYNLAGYDEAEYHFDLVRLKERP